jgi:IS30 family transposase
VHDATIKVFEKYHDKIKTITVDNGKEFADADLTGIYL